MAKNLQRTGKVAGQAESRLHSNRVKQPKVARSDAEMLSELRASVKRLQAAYDQVFQAGDMDYCGAVVSELATLVCTSKTNVPLLLELMRRQEAEIRLTLRGRLQRIVTLPEYLAEVAVMVDVPSMGLVSLTREKLIWEWRCQSSTAHQDWELKGGFHGVRSTGIYFFDIPAHIYQLGGIVRIVLHFATEFLSRQ